jgi:tetratricopeptide (TPR) repeat protein
MIAKVSALILLFLTVNLCAQNSPVKPVPPTQEDELKKHISAAETYQISGDLENARLENRAIVAIGLQRAGNLAIEEGKYREAVERLTESKAYRDNTRVRIDLAVALLRMRELERALEEARTAVELDPQNAYARYILGNIYFTKEDYAAALPHLEKVLILTPNFEVARALGLTYLYLKQPDRARLLFEEMLEAFKGEKSELHMIFGQVYEQTNYPLEAERELRRTLEINPKHKRANFFLGYVILQHGGSARLSEAGQFFEKELQLAPGDFYANFFAGVVASSENNHRKAIGFLQKALELNPKSGEVYLFLGQSQIELNDLAAAEKNLRRAVELEANEAKDNFQARRTHFLLGRLLVRTNRREEGEKELEIAKRIQQKSLDSARDEINQILSQVVVGSEKAPVANPVDREAALPAARVAELKKVKDYLADVLAQAYFNLAVVAVQTGQMPDALAKFAAAGQWQPDFPNLNRNWGIVAFRSGQYEQAVKPLARQMRAVPQDTLARQMLGASYFFTKDFKNTVETLNPLAAGITRDAELAYFYGLSLIQIEKNQEARAVFEKLALEAQKNPEVLTDTAQGFMFLGDYERAVKEFRTVSALAPNTPKINYLIGQSLIRLNRFDEAEQHFQKELALNPVDETSKYHLALTLIERKTRIEEAMKLLSEAIALRSDYADAHYQLGKIYIEKGETERAIAQLETAVSADAKKDYIHYQLSIAYRKASRRDEADRELKIYQELKSQNRKAENLMPVVNRKNAP